MTRETKLFLVLFAIVVLIGSILFAIDYRAKAAQEADQIRAAMKINDTKFVPAVVPASLPVFSLDIAFRGLIAGFAVFALMEFVILRLLGLSRVGAIVRVTYYEALLQPFSLIVLGLGIAAIIITGYVPYFTQDEEPKMFRDVSTQILLLAGMILMVFASGKVVDEEIENRTMLTLLSKPIGRWQVIVGKFLGVLCLVAVAVAIMGITVLAFSWIRYVTEARIDFQVARGVNEVNAILLEGERTLLQLIPYFALIFLQLATLCAISVALSTRYGMALNFLVIIMVYLAANLFRYVDVLDISATWKHLAVYTSYLLPNLNDFDIQPRLIYGRVLLAGEEPIKDTPYLSQVWSYVGLTTVYGLMYIGAALSAAVALFRTRELT